MINAKITYLGKDGDVSETTVQGIIGTVYGQRMFFHTVDTLYRLKVIEEHEPDPETGEVASWNSFRVSDDVRIIDIEIAGQDYEVLSREPR